MRVQVENTGEIGRRMTVSVPSDEFESAMSKRVSELSRTINLPGFRPGKVPRKVIEKRYGQELKGEILGGIIERTYVAALDQEGLSPATEPSIEPTATERGEDIEYVASFDIFPEIPKAEITGTKIEKPVCEVQESDIDTTLERMRKQRVEYNPSDDAAKADDRVTLDFTGTIDGEAFEGGAAEDYPLVLGSGAVLSDLDEGIVGMVVDEEKTIDVNFPDDYPKEELGGKTAQFAVKLNQIDAPQMPELDDAFVKTFGIEDGNLETLRSEIRTSLERERDDRVQKRIKDQILTSLIEQNEFELPEKMVEKEVNSIVESTRRMLESQGGDASAELEDSDREMFQSEASRRVSLGLIIRSIVIDNKIEPDPEKIKERVATLAQGYEHPQQVVQYYLSDNERRGQLEAAVIEDQVVEHLLAQADLEEVSVSFADLMYTEQG